MNRRALRACSGHYGFRWVRNSCYLDTVLWVLFGSSISFVDDKLLFPRRGGGGGVFKDVFRDAAYYFRCGVGSDTCASFRRIFKEHYRSGFDHWPKFYSSRQQEAHEFLQFVLSLYGSHGAVSRQDFYYGVSSVPRVDTPWRHVRARNDKTQGLVWSIPYHVLRDTPSKDRTLETFLGWEETVWNVRTEHKRCAFNAIRTAHSLQRFADMLVFSVQRTNPTKGTVSRFRVGIPDTLTDKGGKVLSLFGVICHHGETTHSGHYTATAYSSSDRQWYYYDDTNLPVQPVSSWKDVPHIATHCVLIFYTRLPS